MNRDRRKELDRAAGLLDEAKTIIEACKEEEQEALDNLPESVQEGERGQAMETAIEELETAADGIDDIVENINAAKGE